METIRKWGVCTPEYMNRVYGVSTVSQSAEWMATIYPDFVDRRMREINRKHEVLSDLERITSHKVHITMVARVHSELLRVYPKWVMCKRVFPELLEWCDRPEDERRCWHIANRYLED